MLNEEQIKNELISIKRRLRQILYELKKAKLMNNFDLAHTLKIDYLILEREKTRLENKLTSLTNSDAFQFNTAPSVQNEIEPNQYLILIAGFLFSDELRETALGDFGEHFHNNFKKNGKAKAYCYLLRDILESAYPVLKEAISKQIKTNQIGLLDKVIKIQTITSVIGGAALSHIFKNSYQDTIIAWFIICLFCISTAILLAITFFLIYNLNNSTRK
jgi:hypothetical protein